MEENTQPVNRDDKPPIPKFSFSKGVAQKSKPSNQPQVTPAKKSETSNRKPKQCQPAHAERKTSRLGVGETIVYSPPRYDNLSTKARQSVQQKLATLRREREKQGHEVCTIKLFIEQAVQHWLKSPAAKMTAANAQKSPARQSADDPYLTFNNVMLEELQRELKDICHERNSVKYPVRTIIAILDEAFSLWLPLQEEFAEGESNLAETT